MKPCSVFDTAGGMVYFPRMLDKIRLHEAGTLDASYWENLGGGMDRRCANFLRMNYEDLRECVLEGGSDEEVLEWCFENGRRLDENDITIWNAFASKLGWNDFASGYFEQQKESAGLSARDDIRTLAELFDAEERE